MSYAIYLRKSREDREAEARGEGETLARHRTALLDLARNRLLDIGAVYEEIVSGETLAARPQMQQLLEEVAAGKWEGVLVMEVERLARGNGIDQGMVSQAFSASGTKIITPYKTYDPSNEMDEDYFEFGLFMSRREFQTINRRLVAGRIASVKEGKYLGGRDPYGYERYKLPKEKGWSLRVVPEQAEIVKRIYRWYLDGIGSHAIATRLAAEGATRTAGTSWTSTNVLRLLKSPLYCGYVKWGHYRQKKEIRDGKLHKCQREQKEYLKVKGRHEALVSEADWNAVQQRIAARPGVPMPGNRSLRNPFQGILYCKCCGHRIQMETVIKHPADGSVKRFHTLACRYPTCNVISSMFYMVEDALMDALREMLHGYQLDLSAPQPGQDGQREQLRAEIRLAEREIAKADEQLRRAFELVEQEIYTPEQFVDRRRELLARKETQQAALQTLSARLAELDAAARLPEIMIPAITNVLEAYPLAETPEEKQKILQSAISRIEYEKLPEPGVRAQDCKLKLVIYPRIPHHDTF